MQFSVRERDTDRLVGDVGISPADGEPGIVKVGYTISPSVQGRGYATEAVGALVDYAFGTLGADVIRAYASADNLPSIRVAEKVGMTLIERFTGHDEDGEWTGVRYERAATIRRVSPSNADLVELLRRAGDDESDHRRRALHRASRAAMFWSEEADDLAATGRSLTELRSVGPWVEAKILGWIEQPPDVPEADETDADTSRSPRSDVSSTAIPRGRPRRTPTSRCTPPTATARSHCPR